MTKDEEFLSSVGDVFGFLIARNEDDIEAANTLLAHADVIQLLINMTDFCLAQLTMSAEELGVPVKTIIQTLAMASQAVGPEMLKKIGDG